MLLLETAVLLVTSGTFSCDYIDTEKEVWGKERGIVNHGICLKLLFFYKKPFQVWKCREYTDNSNCMFKVFFTSIFFCTILKDKLDGVFCCSFWTFRIFNLGGRPPQKGIVLLYFFCCWKDTLKILWELSTKTLWELISVSTGGNGEYAL